MDRLSKTVQLVDITADRKMIMGHPVHFYPYGEFVHTTSFNLFLIKSNKYLDMMSAGNLQTILGRSCGYQRMEVVSHVLLYLHKYHYI